MTIIDYHTVNDEGVLVNLKTYLRGNKNTAAPSLMIDTKLDKKKLKATQAKIKDKMPTIVSAYKSLRQKTQSTSWRVTPTEHGATLSMGNPEQETI